MKEKPKHENNGKAKLVGFNMEGPFISEKKKGDQAAKNIRTCNVSLFRKLQEESGNRIKLIDIVPETESVMSFIETVKDEVAVSIAYTMADYETAKTALKKERGM